MLIYLHRRSKMTNAELTKLVTTQKNTIERLNSRVGNLVDELAVLRSDISVFGGQVADDMRRMLEAVQKK